MASEKQCARALELGEERLSGLANVVGLGIVSADPACPESDDVAVAVYVEKKLPLAEIAEADRIPKTLRIQEANGTREIPVRVIVQGEISLEESAAD